MAGDLPKLPDAHEMHIHLAARLSLPRFGAAGVGECRVPTKWVRSEGTLGCLGIASVVLKAESEGLYRLLEEVAT